MAAVRTGLVPQSRKANKLPQHERSTLDAKAASLNNASGLVGHLVPSLAFSGDRLRPDLGP